MNSEDKIHVKVSIDMIIDKDYKDKLENILNHHIDWLLDLDSNEEIRSVFNCELEEISNTGRV